MKNRKLLDILGDMDDVFIEEASPKQAWKKSYKWMKWCSFAACLAVIVLAGASAFYRYRDDSGDKCMEIPVVIDYDQAYYEVISGREKKTLLKKYGLPEKIGEELIGDHITYLEKDGNADYKTSTWNTSVELLEYASAPCKGLRILREKDSYSWVVFCNYHMERGESLLFEEIFSVYGIEDAEDITSITAVKDDTWKKSGRCVTDAEEIQIFYDAAVSLQDYSFDEYEEITFGGKLAENDTEGRRYEVYAGSCRNLLVETEKGLKFKITYNKDFGWMMGSETQSCYELSHLMLGWLSMNFDD